MTPAPKRRWIRFSLRGLLVLVTIVGVWLGLQAQQVAHRAQIRQLIESRGGTLSELSYTAGQGLEPPWVWRLMGDRATRAIRLPPRRFNAAEVEHIRATFFEGPTFWPEQPQPTPDSAR